MRRLSTTFLWSLFRLPCHCMVPVLPEVTIPPFPRRSPLRRNILETRRLAMQQEPDRLPSEEGIMHNGPSAAEAAVGSLMRFVFPSAPAPTGRGRRDLIDLGVVQKTVRRKDPVPCALEGAAARVVIGRRVPRLPSGFPREVRGQRPGDAHPVQPRRECVRGDVYVEHKGIGRAGRNRHPEVQIVGGIDGIAADKPVVVEFTNRAPAVSLCAIIQR